MKKILLSVLPALAIALFSTSDAEAQVSAGALAGYGVDFEDGDLNPFGVSLGGRVGYTLPMSLYLGGSAMFHVGGSEEAGGVEATIRMLQIGAEVGYDAALSEAFTLRPYVGLGVNTSFLSVSADSSFAGVALDDEETENDLFLNVGAAALYHINDSVFVGGDLRFSNVFAEDETLNGMVFLATAGARFGS